MLTAPMKTNTWNFVPLHSQKKAIECKQVFKLKLHANGTIKRYKAIIVAKGFTQIEGIDYMVSYNLVLLTIVASHNWPHF